MMRERLRFRVWLTALRLRTWLQLRYFDLQLSPALMQARILRWRLGVIGQVARFRMWLLTLGPDRAQRRKQIELYLKQQQLRERLKPLKDRRGRP
jgi:hypothetical protein